MPSRQSSPRAKLRKFLTGLFFYLLFLILAVIMIWPQLKHQAFICGTDSLFHMNRFYETMMQFKTGHFSYFQSIFGFHQVGRLVNAFYGPVFAYLNGLILLVVGSWYHFQIVTSLLSLSIAGWAMHRLCVKNGVKPLYSLVAAGLYMTCYPVSSWTTSQKFTGWGAAFMPLLMLCGTEMLRRHRIRVVPLALTMTLLLQTHVLSSLIGCLALIPLFIVGYLHATNRPMMRLEAFQATGLTILLTANVWGGMVDLFSTNHIVPAYPPSHFIAKSVHFQSAHFSLNLLGPVFSIAFVLVAASLFLNWRQEPRFQKTLDLTGLCFLFIASQLFPWSLVHRYCSPVTNIIQFPFRFLVIPDVLLLLSLGITFSRIPTLTWLGLTRHYLSWLGTLVAVVALIMAVSQVNYKINTEVHTFYSDQVVNQRPRSYQRYIQSSRHFRQHFRSRDRALVLSDVDKEVPDYLPVSKFLKQNYGHCRINPYRLVNHQLNHNRHPFKKRIVNGDQLKVSWVNHTDRSKLVTVPLVAYRQSVVHFNHLIVHPRLSPIGSIEVRGRPGRNVVTLKYYPDFSMKIANLLTILVWLGLLAYLILSRSRAGDHDEEEISS